MSLFGKKKEEEKKTQVCACRSGCSAPEAIESAGNCRIKVLGAGCASCHTLYENTKEAIQKMGLLEEVEYVTDMQKIMEYGVMSMPALVVNEKAVSMGKVLKSADVEKLLHKSGF